MFNQPLEWQHDQGFSAASCQLCGGPAYWLGASEAGTVWLCVGCADALADAVNQRRAERRAAMDAVIQDSVEMGVYD